MLGLQYTKRSIEFYPAAEHKKDEFLAINPLGQLPVLTDDALTLCDSHAIMAYLAHQYDKSCAWYPTHSPATLAHVTRWMCFAEQITTSASGARLADGFFYELDADACRVQAHQLFRIFDQHLWYQEREEQSWVVSGTHASIADIACFAYTMLCEEGGISRMDYPAIRRWTDRVKRLPGFIVMPGIFPAGPDIAPMQDTRDTYTTSSETKSS